MRKSSLRAATRRKRTAGVHAPLGAPPSAAIMLLHTVSSSSFNEKQAEDARMAGSILLDQGYVVLDPLLILWSLRKNAQFTPEEIPRLVLLQTCYLGTFLPRCTELHILHDEEQQDPTGLIEIFLEYAAKNALPMVVWKLEPGKKTLTRLYQFL